jgi:hypothetical protein
MTKELFPDGHPWVLFQLETKLPPQAPPFKCRQVGGELSAQPGPPAPWIAGQCVVIHHMKMAAATNIIPKRTRDANLLMIVFLSSY